MADGVLEKHSIMDELLAVLARTTDGVFALDQAGQVVFWNAAAERITGYLADEVLGRPCYEISAVNSATAVTSASPTAQCCGPPGIRSPCPRITCWGGRKRASPSC